MEREAEKWRGVWAAIPTPFGGAGGGVDHGRLREHARWLCRGGIDGIVVVGTTGEAATMGAEERSQAVRTVVEAVGGRVRVMAGAGTNDTASTIWNAHAMADAGAEAVLIVTPYYNKPNQEGLYRHFSAVADESDVPVFAYNVPGRTGCCCSPATLGRLAKHQRILGTKDATGNMIHGLETSIATSGEDFIMLSGDDGTFLPFISIGGAGIISVVANVAPRAMRDVYDAYIKGDAEAWRAQARIHGLFKSLFSDTSPIPLKAVMSRMFDGYPEHLRMPLVPMDTDSGDALYRSVTDMLETH